MRHVRIIISGFVENKLNFLNDFVNMFFISEMKAPAYLIIFSANPRPFGSLGFAVNPRRFSIHRILET